MRGSKTARKIHFEAVRSRHCAADTPNAEDAFSSFPIANGQPMRAIYSAHSSIQIMNPCIGITISEIVLINNAHKPMWAPCVFRENGRPIALVLLGEKCLEFRPEALSFSRFNLGFYDMDVGINDAFESSCDRGCEGVKFQVVEGVFPLELFGDLSANLNIEITNEFAWPETP